MIYATKPFLVLDVYPNIHILVNSGYRAHSFGQYHGNVAIKNIRSYGYENDAFGVVINLDLDGAKDLDNARPVGNICIVKRNVVIVSIFERSYHFLQYWHDKKGTPKLYT